MFQIRTLVKGSKEIGSILKFKIEKYATSLLGGVQADVIITYTNEKKVMVFGDEKDVFEACIARIKLAKTPGRAAKLAEVFTEHFKGTDVDQPRNLAKSVTVE